MYGWSQRSVGRTGGVGAVPHEVWLAQLSRVLVYALLLIMVWQGYEFWQGELAPELDAIDSGAAQVAGQVSNGQARESLFVILAVTLAAPLALLVGWMVVGLSYNLLHATVVKILPRARYLVMPAVLFGGLHLADVEREQIKDVVTEGYRLVGHQMGSARQMRIGQDMRRPVMIEQ